MKIQLKSHYRKLQTVGLDVDVYVQRDKQGIKIQKKTSPIRPITMHIDTVEEMLNRLNIMVSTEYRELSRHEQLKYEQIVDMDSTLYQLDMSVNNYRQSLHITQSKPRLTRSVPHTLFISDIENFRKQLRSIVDELRNKLPAPADSVDELAYTHLTPIVVEEHRAVNKGIGGNLVAVVYSTIRSWPLGPLFDPKLITLIENGEDVTKIRDYCERAYPDLKNDFDCNDNLYGKWEIIYGSLKVQWIPQAALFHVINARYGQLDTGL